jgi:uncharacterized protein (TIGR02246 family)
MSDHEDDTHEACLRRIEAAWNAADARAYAAEFTEDATYVIFLGMLLAGRAEIEANHRDVFNVWQKGKKMAVKPLQARSLSDDVASVLTIGGLGDAGSIRFDKFQTFTFVKRGKRWLCASFHNTKMGEEAEARYN